jgi:hypothetical protein
MAEGYLLGKIGLFRLPWSALVGAAMGLLAVLAVLEIHRRIKPNGNPSKNAMRDEE